MKSTALYQPCASLLFSGDKERIFAYEQQQGYKKSCIRENATLNEKNTITY